MRFRNSTRISAAEYYALQEVAAAAREVCIDLSGNARFAHRVEPLSAKLEALDGLGS
jgi:hypothetical protein